MTTLRNKEETGRATGYVYMYQAALYCESCGEALRAELGEVANGFSNVPDDPDDESSYDSDTYPKGPMAEGSADSPTHCEGCGVFLENDLTPDGLAYVKTAVAEAWQAWKLDGVAITEWAPFYDIGAPDYIGPESPLSSERRIELLNPSDRDWCDTVFIMWVGEISPRHFAVWLKGDDLCAAIEVCADWIEDNAPGLFCDESVCDEYRRAYRDARAMGADDEQAEEHAREEAEVDTTPLDGGHYLNSDHWGYIAEDPTAEEILSLLS